MAKKRANAYPPGYKPGSREMNKAAPEFVRKCEELGYDPAEALILYRQMLGELVQELFAAADRGIKHEHYPSVPPAKLREIAIEHLASLIEMDMDMMPYRYPKLAAQSPVDDDGNAVPTEVNLKLNFRD